MCAHNGSQRKAASALDKSVQATQSQATRNKGNALAEVSELSGIKLEESRKKKRKKKTGAYSNMESFHLAKRIISSRNYYE